VARGLQFAPPKKVEGIRVSRLLGGAIQELEAAMRFRVARQAVLAANVSNADTPGYRRAELEVARAQGAPDGAPPLRRTHAGHLDASGRQSGDPSSYRLTRGPVGTRPDRNGVDLDDELVQLGRNAGAFQDQAAVLNRLLVLRRIGATGNAG